MSNTRNGLLAQIVQAAGGTVTDSSNRNSLLQDWLDAVSGPAGRWYFSGNGVDQYITTPSIVFNGDVESIKFSFNAETLQNSSIIGNRGSGAFYFGLVSSGAFRLKVSGASYNVPNLTYAAGVNYDVAISRVGTVFTVTVNGIQSTLAAGDGQFTVSGIGSVVNALFFHGKIYNYSDSLGNVFPLDDSFANNPVARNTGTGANSTYINATEASWSFE